jgi:hypothetical protein
VFVLAGKRLFLLSGYTWKNCQTRHVATEERQDFTVHAKMKDRGLGRGGAGLYTMNLSIWSHYDWPDCSENARASRTCFDTSARHCYASILGRWAGHKNGCLYAFRDWVKGSKWSLWRLGTLCEDSARAVQKTARSWWHQPPNTELISSLWIETLKLEGLAIS